MCKRVLWEGHPLAGALVLIEDYSMIWLVQLPGDKVFVKAWFIFFSTYGIIGTKLCNSLNNVYVLPNCKTKASVTDLWQR